jgi:hypothetical protein
MVAIVGFDRLLMKYFRRLFKDQRSILFAVENIYGIF